MAMNTVDQLNSFLRGEISAAETCRQAVGQVKDPSVKSQLMECQRSHESRVELLRTRIRQIGGTPSEGGGAWGSFAKVVQGGAGVFSEKAAVAALEEGEDHGLKDYTRDINKLDPDTRRLVETELIPAQKRTHDMVSQLKQTIK